MANDVSRTEAPAAPPDDAYRRYLRMLRWRGHMVRLCQLGLLVLVLVVWQVGPRMHWINPMLTSYPSAIWTTLGGLLANGQIFQHVWATLISTLIGFSAGMIIGIACAVGLWWSDFMNRVLEPYLVVANAMPKIAFVPIFYIWLGAVASIYGMAVAINVFVTIIILNVGFRSVDPDKLRLARIFGASRGQLLTKVVIPGSVPSMVAALKVNVGLTLVGVIVGEFQSAKEGLGYLIVYGSQIFQMNLVMAAVVLLGVISVVLYAAIEQLEHWVLRHRGGR